MGAVRDDTGNLQALEGTGNTRQVACPIIDDGNHESLESEYF
jgi:hypothetical protein